MSILQDAIKKKNEEMGKATSPSSTQSKSILSAAIQTKKETGKLPATSVPVKKQEKTSYQETMQQAETALQKKATLQSERDRLKSELGELNRTKYNLTPTDRTYQVRAAGGDNEENRKRKDLEEQLAAVEKEIQQLEYVDQYEGKTYEDNFPGQFAANKDLGRITQDVNAAYSKYLMEPTQANKEYADALAKLAEDFQMKNSAALDEENARWALVSKTLAGYIPQLVDQTKAQATGALVGGAAGSVVPVLGTVAGAKAGMVVASGAQSYNQMRGAAFRELLEAGMDEETARAAANDEAILSSLIEMADTGVDLATLGTGKLLTMLGKGGVKAAAGEAAETAGKKFVKALAKYGVNVGSEMAQEGAQQAISIGNRERSGTGMGDLAKSAVETARGALTGENKEAAAEIMEAAREGGKIAALMGGATMAATGIANNAMGKKATANTGEIKAAGETEAQGNISAQPEAAKEAAQSETGEAAVQTQDALAEYPNLQKAAKGETGVDANEVAREAAAAVQQGAITREEGRELTRRAIASAKAKQEAAAQVQETAAAAEERAPGYYGSAEDPDAAYLDRLGKAAGVSIEKVPAAQAGNREGWIIGGKVYLSEGTEDVQRIVAKHEVTHHLQEMAPEAYNNFRSYVEKIYRQRGTLEQQIEGLTNLYRENNQELTAEGALDELTANYAGELMENENLIRRLAGEDRSLGQQILDAIREILRRMRAAFGDQETRQLERAARLWEKALKETNEAYYQQGKRSGNQQVRNMYAGEKSATADLDALARAKEMDNQDVSAETIRQQTGWFKSMDGKWRYEIDDSKMRYERRGDLNFRKRHEGYDRYRELTRKAEDFMLGQSEEWLTMEEQQELTQLQSTWGNTFRTDGRVAPDALPTTKLTDYIDHPELFAAYPRLQDASLVFAELPEGTRGQYDRENNIIRVSRDLRHVPQETLLHEIQHAVQQIEGFTGGASVEYWENQQQAGRNKTRNEGAIRAANQKYRDLFDTAPEELRQTVRKINQAKLAGDWDTVLALENEIYDGPYADIYTELGDADFDRRTLIEQNEPISAKELYRNTAGEIEARDTGKRRDLTADERKKTAPDLGGKDTVFAEKAGWSRSEYDPETATIKEQLENSREMLNGMKLAASVAVPTKFKGKKDATKWAIELLKSTGYQVDNQDYGVIRFNPDDINAALNYADTDAEKAAIAALPGVLKRGKEIGRHKNHKERNKETYTLAAPVELNGQKGHMAVVVTKYKNHYETHRIVMPDGTVFKFSENNKDAAPEPSRGGAVSSSLAETTSAASGKTIAQERSSVKGARELQKMIDSGALKTYEQITDAQNGLYQQERDLAERKRAAVNSPELTKAMDEYSGMFDEMRQLLPKRRNGTATQAELDRIEEIKTLREEKMAEIVDLQERLGLKEIEEEEAAIRETKEQLRVAADEAWEREGAEKEDAAIAKAGMSSADYFRKKALKAFKTTTNFNEAGYLLPDGKMLNFSGGERNHRYRDHREIGEIYEATNGVKALNRFLADGNIRVMAESPGIDLAAGVEPTYEQYAALKKFINSNGKKEGQFFVDFSGKDGRREGNYSYTSGVNADRIINDIKYYYETGKIREQSAVSMFHERDSVKGARELQQQIDRLTKQNKRLQAQMKISNMPKASRKAVEQQATELRKAYGSTMDKAELTERLEKLYEGMYAQSGGKGRKTMSWEDIRTEARSIADAILADATGNVNPKAEEYAQLRKELRTRKISISEQDRADLASMGGYNELRKRNMGSLTLSKEGTPVDIVYQELSDQYPELFPDDIYHPADQLMRISDVVQELKTVEGNPYEQDMENTAAYLAGEIEERFYDTPTEVEALESQLSRQFEKQRRKERDANSKRLLQQQAAHEQVIRDMEERIREENRKRIANQSASERRETIRRHADRLGRKLIRPTDKSHVPAEMRGAALALVRYIDTESSYELVYGKDGKYHRVQPGTELGAEITSRTAAARELQAEYKRLSEDTTLTIDPDMADYLDEIAKMGNKRVADMTKAELDTVWKVMQVIEHTIGQANDLLEESRYRNLQEMANALKLENKGKKDRVDRAGMIGEGDKLLNLDMLTPETYFSRMGEAGKDIFRQMRKAADRQTEILKEGTDRARKLIEESGVSFAKADKEMHTFEVKGGEITLSTGQLMELYALSKRQQAMEHIYEGGLKPVDATVKGKIVGGSKPVKVTPGDVAEMVSALTKEQRELVDGLQKYLSGDLAKHGNEESRKVYGYDKFLEKNYWPIKVSSTEVASDPGKAATAKTIPGYGMTKALKPKANNAVELRSAIDTYSRHLNQMATYAAWLGTNENVTRLQNFKFETKDGQPDGNVKQLIEKVYGKSGNDYLQNLLSDIAQGTKAGADRSLAERGLSQFKAAKVGGNLRVIIQQPTAILRAMEMVDPKYFASGKTTSGKGWEKAVKYAPIAQWKDWGYFEMDTGMSLRELMTGTENKLDKVKNALMAPAGAADSVAWGYLWNAVEAETADTHPELQKGTEAFYRAVADRFSEVVDHTQVVDSVLHRSQIMRSSNYLSKVSTSFMSEPMKVYNMVVRDLYDMRSATSEEARKKAGKQLGKTAAALVTSFAVNALAQSIVDGMRDDDREKKYLDKVADQWLENFTENFNPIGYIPYAKDVQSLLQGYTLERSEMEGVAELITSMQNLWKAKEGESQKTVLAAGLEAASKLGDLIGLPVSNLKRDAEAIVRTVMISAGASKALYEWDKKVYNPEKAMGKFYDDMYRAMDTDQDTYEMIYDDVLGMLQEQGMDADEAAGKIKSNVENRMKKELGLDKTSSLPIRYSAPGEDDVFDELMREAEADGGSWAEAFGEETVEMARELDAMDDATKVQRVAQIGVMPFAENVREDALESVLTATEWDRYRAAKAAGVKLIDWCDFYESVKDERILRTGKSGTESQEDVEAVLNRMNLTDEQKTAIWNSYGWKAESQWS